MVEREYIDRLMPFTAQLGVEWRSTEKDMWAEGVCRFADDADKLSTRDMGDTQRVPPGGTPGYILFDVRWGWDMNKNVRLDIGLENIFDHDYRVHGSGSNSPGRNLIFGITLRG